jgi:hypothetical protein
MFAIEMLPARHGDCLWIEYGDARAPRRILIDGGTKSSYPNLRTRVEALDPADRHFELFVVTHVDTDHIDGAIKLLGDAARLGVTFGDVWFNGYGHLAEGPRDVLGARQGEELALRLLGDKLPWNEAFGHGAVVVGDSLPSKTLDGGMTLTVLSPTPAGLAKLRPVWKEVVESGGHDPTETTDPNAARRPPRDRLGGGLLEIAGRTTPEDTAVANGSSIAIVAEFDEKRCLLGADAHPGVLLESLGKLPDRTASGRVALDAYKVSHHGSSANTTKALLDSIRCPLYLISTDGSQFRHPDEEAIARLVAYSRKPHIAFNYKTAFNERWERGEPGYDFTTSYPVGAVSRVEL